ncbi:AAA family ATPase [Candidatus Ishikawella capsulata]|uniref:endopeptidase La n=1 Tax=Candidatus Ishikawaella capsulata Mpkobe TaxID=476281 RepID=C5WDM6_9ENTR|nr:Lon protease family protein [Candidatus Ishikawaella capsulata]BAH83432.1 predicted peptidase [Candidatus Ishikawaella capsulata Mpkobe]
MNILKLTEQNLRFNTDSYKKIFSQNFIDDIDSFSLVQPRLFSTLTNFCRRKYTFPILLIRSQENINYLAKIANVIKRLYIQDGTLYGGEYHITSNNIILKPPKDPSNPFTSLGKVIYAEWIELEKLLGSVHAYKKYINLIPGIVHQANGGFLLLSLRTLLKQPLMWKRLKQCIIKKLFEWFIPNNITRISSSIPALPMNLRLVLCGEYDSLASLQQLEPEIHKLAIYTEFEEQITIITRKDMFAWCHWTSVIAREAKIPHPQADFWPVLIHESSRYTGAKNTLSLCPCWLLRQLQEAMLYGNILNKKSLQKAIEIRYWHENYVYKKMYNEIILKTISVQTEGKVIGQINALSVFEYAGHPLLWGQPSRITCVVYLGDGECIDIESKTQLGNNIHAKGVMIMQSYLHSKLALEQHIPFSASLVFEQSYEEIDGDSASLAELCAVISAISSQPIDQQIAVTGSIDQFGNVQPVAGLNEKIEGFFYICYKRYLTHNQGVIIPADNVNHLSLNEDVIKAIQEKKFHIWAIKHVDQALQILTGLPWDNAQGPSLIKKIKEKICKNHKTNTNEIPWLFRWLNWGQ